MKYWAQLLSYEANKMAYVYEMVAWHYPQNRPKLWYAKTRIHIYYHGGVNDPDVAMFAVKKYEVFAGRHCMVIHFRSDMPFESMHEYRLWGQVQPCLYHMNYRYPNSIRLRELITSYGSVDPHVFILMSWLDITDVHIYPDDNRVKISGGVGYGEYVTLAPFCPL